MDPLSCIRCTPFAAYESVDPSSEFHTMKNNQSLTDVPFVNNDLFILVVSVDTSEKPGRKL